jgi:hypothetical protein
MLLGSALCVIFARAVAAVADADVVAMFKGGSITRADVENVIAHKLPEDRARIAAAGTGAVRELVESLIRYDLLVLEAEARGYGKNREVVDATRRKESELLVVKATGVDSKSIPATEVEKMHAERHQEFERPAMRRAAHIVVATRAEAVTLIGELKHSDRERFARMATERSLDRATRHQGGELGYFTQEGKADLKQRSELSPQLIAAAYALPPKPNTVAPQPIELPNGFSVLMLTGLMSAHVPPAGEVEEQLRADIADKQQKQKAEQLVQQLRETAKPVLHPELVDQVVIATTNTETARIPEGFPAAPPDPREAPKVIAPDGF